MWKRCWEPPLCWWFRMGSYSAKGPLSSLDNCLGATYQGWAGPEANTCTTRGKTGPNNECEFYLCTIRLISTPIRTVLSGNQVAFLELKAPSSQAKPLTEWMKLSLWGAWAGEGCVAWGESQWPDTEDWKATFGPQVWGSLPLPWEFLAVFIIYLTVPLYCLLLEINIESSFQR